jgi:[ribosomal protein S18]-alanine N-acetyltransferase
MTDYLDIYGECAMTENSENSPAQIEINKLQTPDEAHQCATLMATSEPWLTLGRTYDLLIGMFDDPLREFYIATQQGRFAGFVILQMYGTFTGYIQSIGVVPEYRNQGIGSALMRFSEQRIFCERPNVFICVSSFNKKAQKLYNRLGYEMVGELKDFLVVGYSEFLLRKTIGPLRDFKKPQ